MAKVLVIDGCARGWEVSRTYAVAEKFIKRYKALHPEDEVEELHLIEEDLTCLTGSSLEKREELLAIGAETSGYFAFAEQFAQADKLLLVAPYWDLSFPSIVKVYIEAISVRGITFRYGADGGAIGLCRGKKLFYLTTSGGKIDLNSDNGSVLAYLRSLCSLYGIKTLEHLWLQGLDCVDANINELLANGFAQAEKIAESW